VLVWVDADAASPTGLPQAEALVINTESRHVEASEAASRVRTAVMIGREWGAEFFYKKVDSTLRGNVGSELEAFRAATSQLILPFIPALPKLARTVQQGRLFVGGRPLDQTAFARDPLNPMTESDVPAILGAQTSLPTQSINGRDEATEFMPGICVFDAESDEDQRIIGARLRRSLLLTAVAGSAGFAEYLPDLLDLPRETIAPPRLRGPIFAVNGSLNEASLAQFDRAHDAGFTTVTLQPPALLPPGATKSAAVQALIEQAAALLRVGKHVALRTAASRADVQYFLAEGQRCGLTPGQTAHRLAARLGEVVAAIHGRCAAKQYIVFGGDTLLAVARAMGWRGLLPRGEPLPGVVISEVCGHEGEFAVNSKAGGFGTEDVLSRLLQRSGDDSA
jgi:uncharacterized protein YgbK (DUF1537 family)